MRADSEQIDLMANARVGTTIKGKWHLDRLIGVGGMAAVYAATHRNRKRAALKILHPEFSRNDSIRERFLREGYVANTVGHAGVIRVDDDDVTEDGSVFLVMELVEGETLDQRLTREGPLPADEVLGYFDQVLDTVAMAHARGIVHRDLKPENMLLSHDGRVRLLDFGIARVRELTTDPKSTPAEGLIGTPAFMPPEQASGRWDEVDIRSDLWSIGASMFTLLTGCYVHDAETVRETLAVAIAERARPLKDLRPDLPDGLCQLVDRALQYEKSARWPNATAMLLAVQKVRAKLKTSVGEAQRAEAVLLSARASDPEIEVLEGLDASLPRPPRTLPTPPPRSTPPLSAPVEVDDDDWPDPTPVFDTASSSDAPAVLDAPARPDHAPEAEPISLLDASSASDATAVLDAPSLPDYVPPAPEPEPGALLNQSALLDASSNPDVTAVLETPDAVDAPPDLDEPPAIDVVAAPKSHPRPSTPVPLSRASTSRPAPISQRGPASQRAPISQRGSAPASSPVARSLGANLLAHEVPFGAITFDPASPIESPAFAVSATATPEPELGASAAEKLRRAVAALEAFEDQRKADARLSAEEGDTEVSAPKLELMAASRPGAPLGDAERDEERGESPSVRSEPASYRPPDASDDELTVVRPNPLVAQERAAYRDSQLEIVLPETDDPVLSAEPLAPAAASEKANTPAEPTPGAPAAASTPPPAPARPTAPATPSALAAAPAADTRSVPSTPPALAKPSAPPPRKAAPPRRSPAPPRTKYLEPTTPPRADRRGTVDGSAGPTVAVVESGAAAEFELPKSPERPVSTVASGAPTIITRRAPTPPARASSALWSLAAAFVAVAGVVTAVVWFVQKNQTATPTATAAEPPVAAKLQAARTATLAAPAASATPPEMPTAPAPESNTKAESVELEALPVLPSLQVDPARLRLEQAREATKRELAAQEAPEAMAPKPASAPGRAPVSSPTTSPVR